MPTTHAAAARMAVFAGAAIWLAAAIVRTGLQPRRDRRAAEYLQDMRVRAALPGHALFCILNSVWISPAGQRVAAVDLRTGVVCEVWLAESRLAPGTYALVSLRHGVATMLDLAMPTTVVRAKRHEQRVDPREHRTSRVGAGSRRERRAATGIVREAEALLRRH